MVWSARRVRRTLSVSSDSSYTRVLLFFVSPFPHLQPIFILNSLLLIQDSYNREGCPPTFSFIRTVPLVSGVLLIRIFILLY